MYKSIISYFVLHGHETCSLTLSDDHDNFWKLAEDHIWTYNSRRNKELKKKWTANSFKIVTL